MKPIKIQDIRRAVSGKALAPVPADWPAVVSVCTDSKTTTPGSIFVAIVGDKFDAHNFLPEAAAHGAIAALVQKPPAVRLPNMQLLQVPDTRAALGKLARFVRQGLRAKVVAVAGSNGKTSTKHLIGAALSHRLKGSISPKSFNNDIGVPLTIFPSDPLADYLVLELGTNHPGEIRNLTRIALPDIAVITNAGPEHLEFLHDIDGVCRENGSIIEGLDPKGLLIVNGDDPRLLSAVGEWRGIKVTFGFQPSNDLFATDIECGRTGVRFKLNRRLPVFVPLLGRHTAANALVAFAVGRRFNLSEEEIIAGLAGATGAEMRLEAHELKGVLLLNDAYNANPASMQAALDTLKSLDVRGRRIAILGEMKELGAASGQMHTEIGQFAASCALDELICVGRGDAKSMADGAISAGLSAASVTVFPDAAAAALAIATQLKEGDVVLVKASRSIHLEEVARAISVARLGKQS